MTLFSILIPLTLAAVVLVLVFGLISMVKGGEFNRKYGNLLMRWRIIVQAAAVVLIVLSLTLGNG